MDYKDLISIIIPTYNRYNLLEKTINSVLNQTYKNWELIIVDDGSTDGTDVLVNELSNKDSRIRYYWQKNSGESVARNKGFHLAKGDYIGYLDSDDIWHERNLSEKLNALLDSDGKIAGVFSSVKLINREGDFISSSPVGIISDLSQLSFERFIDGSPIYGGPSNVLFKREVISRIGGFNESIQYGEDQLFFLNIRKIFDFIYIDEPLLYYRIHGLNQSLHIKKENVSTLFANRIEILEMFSDSFGGVHSELINQTIFSLRSSKFSWHLYYDDISDLKLDSVFFKNLNKVKNAVLLEKIVLRLSLYAIEKGMNNFEIDEFVKKKHFEINLIINDLPFNWNTFRYNFYKSLCENTRIEGQFKYFVYKVLSKINPILTQKIYIFFNK